MREKYVIHQALFGYRDGHNLLESSVSLPGKARHFLATVTDSSGPETPPDFYGAFTGLPVIETDFYALFRTWPAPEMARPGCVWSHVLLISLSDLARIRHFSCFEDSFRRPSKGMDMHYYADSMVVSEGPGNAVKLDSDAFSKARYLTKILYGNPENGVVILDNNSDSWVKPILDIWSMQWPRLRREFSFSTGSMSDRRLTGASFDIQIAPRGSHRFWFRSEYPTVVANFPQLPDFYEMQEGELHSFLEHGSEKVDALKAFLFDFGSDVQKPRAAFLKLIHVFSILKDPSHFNEALLMVARYFPNKSDASRLKRRLLEIPSNSSYREKIEHSWRIINFLLTSDSASAFPEVDFNLQEISSYLWSDKQDETLGVLKQLIRRKENPAATSFANSIAKSILPSSLDKIANTHPELIPLIVRNAPQLASHSELWKLAPTVQSQAYEALTRIHISEEEWGRIVGAMFVAATFVNVRDAIERAGGFAVNGVFRWFDEEISNDILPSQAWRDSLGDVAYRALTYSTFGPREFALIAWLTPAFRLRQVINAGRHDVLQFVNEPLDGLPKPLRIPTAFVLVYAGLRGDGINEARLLTKFFYVVHDALAANRYPAEMWSLLSTMLPDFGEWENWDQCKRLRHATREWLQQNLKDTDLFLNAARSPEHRKIAVKTLDQE